MDRNQNGNQSRHHGGDKGGYGRDDVDFETVGAGSKRNYGGQQQNGTYQSRKGGQGYGGGGQNYQQQKYSDYGRDSRQGGQRQDRDGFYKSNGGQSQRTFGGDRQVESRGYQAGGGYKQDRAPYKKQGGGYREEDRGYGGNHGGSRPSGGQGNYADRGHDKRDRWQGEQRNDQRGFDDFQPGKRNGGSTTQSHKNLQGYKKAPFRPAEGPEEQFEADFGSELRTPIDRKLSEQQIPMNSASTAISSTADFSAKMQKKTFEPMQLEDAMSMPPKTLLEVEEGGIEAKPATPQGGGPEVSKLGGSKEYTPGKAASQVSGGSKHSTPNEKKAVMSFGQKPIPNHALSLTKQPQGTRQVSVVSNQFRLKLCGSLQVCQYAIEVEPMELWDSQRVLQIVKSKRREMECALGPNVVSGKAIWTLTEIDKSMNWRTIFKGQPYNIMIDKNSMVKVNMSESSNIPESQNVMGQILNIIINNAFRDTNLKQVGRAARFFDVQNPLVIEQAELQVWSGFKAAAINSKLGTMLCIDSIFKFMSTKTCLSMIDDLKRNAKSQHHWETLVKTTFVGNSVISNWGNKRTYIVTDIEFTANPITSTFEYKGKETCVAQYFAMCYNMHITNPKQPLIVVKNQDRSFYLPTEFCLCDRVPDEVRKGRGMRDALAQTRITPEQKCAKIQKMCQDLFKQQSIKDWAIQLDMDPIKMKTQILCPPKIWKQKQIINCDEQVLRRLPVQNPINLKQNQWIMVYGSRQYDLANKVYETCTMACKQLGMRVEEPHFIELDREESMEDLEYYLQQYMLGEKTFQHPSIVMVVLFRETLYPKYKLVFDKFRMPSQVITARNARSFNASKASNILRQVNSKCLGDLFQMKFPDVMDTLRTMLIGIDVCHSGRQSVVGFAASTNKAMSQYYSDYLLVPKGKEIVDDKLKSLIRKAIECFENANKGQKPTNFVIYRDGVGDSQRAQVLTYEIPQLRDVIAELYNKAKDPPQITVVIVNKRITQRYFVQDERGRLCNPPSGTIIDSQMVEQDGMTNEESGGAPGVFDFYLTPANTTQGCVLPTHFYVAQNASCLSKLDIEHLTFALCHFYFNWAGPIKVPAPAQYAHKIADFYTTVGLDTHNRQRLNRSDQNPESQRAMEKVQQHVMPLNEKLHFL